MNRAERRRAAKGTGNRNAIPFIRCTRESMAVAVMRLEQAEQPGAAALVRETMHGDLTLVTVADRAAKVDVADLPLDRTTVLIVGDDDYASTGPTGWKCAEAVISWASCAVVHGSGATAATYLEAAAGARITGACVLVETDADHAAEWAQRFAGKPTLLILPRDGVHPVETETRH